MRKQLFILVLFLLPIMASAVRIDGLYYKLDSKNKVAEIVWGAVKYSGSVVIPEKVEYDGIWYTVTSIDGAFSGCTKLTSVTIPNSVTSIGKNAFYNCTSLTSITIPNSVTSMGDYAFEDCTGLNSITMGNSLTSIGIAAFRGCVSLTSITIPSSITSIDGDAFDECTSLTSVHISDLKSWCNIAFYNLESNPLRYAHHLFLNGVEIKDLVIPNSITSIKWGAFSNCFGLASVTIPNSVESIGDLAFAGCTGLTSVTLPNSLTSIKYRAFYYCTNLQDVYCYARNAPELEDDAFKDASIKNATLHVPTASVSEYNAAPDWKTFKKIEALWDEAVIAKYDLCIDGVIDALDLKVLVNYIKKIDNAVVPQFDINNDNKVTVADVVLMIDFIQKTEGPQ